MREYVVDLSAVASWPDFIAAFNRDFMHPVGNAKWNGNPDAFHDYLWWPDEHPYRLILRGWLACSAQVNEHLFHDGRPILAVIREIIADNPQVEAVLE